MAPQRPKSYGYELRFEGAEVVERVIYFAKVHPLSSEVNFKKSVAVHQEAEKAGLVAVLPIQNTDWRQNKDRDITCRVQGFHADLYQVAIDPEGLGQDISPTELAAILSQTVGIALAAGERLNRTHGALRLESILLRYPNGVPPGAAVSLADFSPLVDNTLGGIPNEAKDVRAFGQLVLALLAGRKDPGNLRKQGTLPVETYLVPNDPIGKLLFGAANWPKWHQLVTELLLPNSTIRTLVQLRQRLQPLAPSPEKIDWWVGASPPAPPPVIDPGLEAAQARQRELAEEQAREQAQTQERERAQTRERERAEVQTRERERIEAQARELAQAQEREQIQTREREKAQAQARELAKTQERERAQARERERAEAQARELTQAQERERTQARERERAETQARELAQAQERERTQARERERAETQARELAQAQERERTQARERERAEAQERERVQARERERVQAREREVAQAQERERAEARAREREQARRERAEKLRQLPWGRILAGLGLVVVLIGGGVWYQIWSHDPIRVALGRAQDALKNKEFFNSLTNFLYVRDKTADGSENHKEAARNIANLTNFPSIELLDATNAKFTNRWTNGTNFFLYDVERGGDFHPEFKLGETNGRTWTVSCTNAEAAFSNVVNANNPFKLGFSPNFASQPITLFFVSETATNQEDWQIKIFTNLAPKIENKNGPKATEVNKPEDFTAEISDATLPFGKPLEVQWTVTKEGNSAPPLTSPSSSNSGLKYSFIHTFPSEGKYSVSVTATDGGGLTKSEEWTIQVNPSSEQLSESARSRIIAALNKKDWDEVAKILDDAMLPDAFRAKVKSTLDSIPTNNAPASVSLTQGGTTTIAIHLLPATANLETNIFNAIPWTIEALSPSSGPLSATVKEWEFIGTSGIQLTLSATTNAPSSSSQSVTLDFKNRRSDAVRLSIPITVSPSAHTLADQAVQAAKDAIGKRDYKGAKTILNTLATTATNELNLLLMAPPTLPEASTPLLIPYGTTTNLPLFIRGHLQDGGPFGRTNWNVIPDKELLVSTNVSLPFSVKDNDGVAASNKFTLSVVVGSSSEMDTYSRIIADLKAGNSINLATAVANLKALNGAKLPQTNQNELQQYLNQITNVGLTALTKPAEILQGESGTFSLALTNWPTDFLAVPSWQLQPAATNDLPMSQEQSGQAWKVTCTVPPEAHPGDHFLSISAIANSFKSLTFQLKISVLANRPPELTWVEPTSLANVSASGLDLHFRIADPDKIRIANVKVTLNGQETPLAHSPTDEYAIRLTNFNTGNNSLIISASDGVKTGTWPTNFNYVLESPLHGLFGFDFVWFKDSANGGSWRGEKERGFWVASKLVTQADLEKWATTFGKPKPPANSWLLQTDSTSLCFGYVSNFLNVANWFKQTDARDKLQEGWEVDVLQNKQAELCFTKVLANSPLTQPIYSRDEVFRDLKNEFAAQFVTKPDKPEDLAEPSFFFATSRAENTITPPPGFRLVIQPKRQK